MRLSLLLYLVPALLLLGSCTSNEIAQWRGPRPKWYLPRQKPVKRMGRPMALNLSFP